MVDSVIQIGEPFELFHDIDGNPLEDGYIYIGDYGVDPITNQLAVYSDSGLTIPLAQPIRTEGGYPITGGTPVNIFSATGFYSITVLNKRGTLIYTKLTVDGTEKANALVFSSLQASANSNLFGIDSVSTVSYHAGWEESTNGPKGGSLYYRDGTTGTASTIYSNRSGFFDMNGDGFSIAFEGVLNVCQFGARSDGVTNDSTACQQVLNYLSTRGGKIVFSGKTLIATALVYSGKSLHIEGDGIEASQILCTAASGLFSLTFTTTTVATDYFTLSNLTILSSGTGSKLVAVSVTFPVTQTLPSSPQCLIENVSIRGDKYGINTATDAYWTRLLRFTNCASTILRGVFLSQIGNELCTAIEVLNSASTNAFYLNMDSVVSQGSLQAISIGGWIESVHLTNCEIAAPQFGININNTSATPHLPLIRMLNTHINAVKRCVYLQNLSDIIIESCNFTCFNDVRNTDTLTVHAIQAVDCENISVIGGVYGVFPSVSTGFSTVANVFSFSACDQVRVQGVDIDVSLGGSQTLGRGIVLSGGTKNALIQDNDFRTNLGSAGVTYVLGQPNIYSNERLVVSDNSFNDGSIGVSYIDIQNGRIQDNKFDGTTTPISVTGGTVPKSAGLLINGNFPRQTQSFTTNLATPSVGSALNDIWDVSNTVATNVTNFIDGYDGQPLTLYFSNGNTTLVNGANIVNVGLVNITPVNGQIVKYRRMYGSWRQV